MQNKIHLVTPLRDEIENIDALFDSISSQNVEITTWVIVENGSTDGSKEILNSKPKPPNVSNLIVLNEDFSNNTYALGSKYSEVIQRGFNEIKKSFPIDSNDLVGINDADSFPEPDYYRKLTLAFVDAPKLGIASGRCVDIKTNRYSAHAKDWVLGSCRLWRYRCLSEAGYIIGPSADTLSLAKAHIKGWETTVIQEVAFRSREVGQRAKQNYYGKSAYYRGNTILYAMLRIAKFAARGKFDSALQYGSGYFGSLINRTPRTNDPEIKSYFAKYLRRKISMRILRN